jgi:hypothetical protein
MLPDFLVEEIAVRESGEGSVFDVRHYSSESLNLTFGITHAVENESIRIEIYGSTDGVFWAEKPIVSFTPKYYCGTYHLIVPRGEARYIKAAWKLHRWSRADKRPFFRFYIFAEPARARTAVAGAA